MFFCRYFPNFAELFTLPVFRPFAPEPTASQAVKLILFKPNHKVFQPNRQPNLYHFIARL
jgi:hypothetical protein